MVFLSRHLSNTTKFRFNMSFITPSFTHLNIYFTHTINPYNTLINRSLLHRRTYQHITQNIFQHRGKPFDFFLADAEKSFLAWFLLFDHKKNTPPNQLVTVIINNILTVNQCTWRILPWMYSISTHWGRVTHISAIKHTIIGSDNGLSPKCEQTSVKSYVKFLHFSSRKCIWKHRLRNGGHLFRPLCVNAK